VADVLALPLGVGKLYLSPVDDDEWGPDQLEEDVLEPGDTLTLTDVPCDDWDIMIIDDDGDECILEEVDLCADEATWTITNEELLVCVVETAEG